MHFNRFQQFDVDFVSFAGVPTTNISTIGRNLPRTCGQLCDQRKETEKYTIVIASTAGPFLC